MCISQSVYLEPKWLRYPRSPEDTGNKISRSTGRCRKKASSTQGCSRTVPQFSTDRALRRLTAEFERDPVYSARYGRWRSELVAFASVEKCGTTVVENFSSAARCRTEQKNSGAEKCGTTVVKDFSSGTVQNREKKQFTLLDLCVSSLRRGHANLLCIVPILSDDPKVSSD